MRERQPLSPEQIARLQAAQARFAEAELAPRTPQDDGRIGAALERLRQWALERSPYGEEIVLHRCPTCGAQEYEDEASGRLKLDHHYGPHHPTTVPAHEGEVMPVRRSFGERDDDDDAIFGIPTPRRAAGY